MHTVLLVLVLARGPLPIPDSAWSKPVDVRENERQEALDKVHAEQSAATAVEPAAEVRAVPVPPARTRTVEDKRFALSLGVATLIGRPSLELEVLPLQHVAAYVAGETAIFTPGYGVQAGVRLRPMKGLVGPWLDLHVRHSRYTGFSFSIAEDLSPGAAMGFSLQSKGGFLFSAGVGASFLVQTEQTRWSVTSKDVGVFVLPVLKASSTSQFGVQPEFKAQVGWAF